MIHAVGVWILLASLAHLPAALPALNAFDPPKRVVWWAGLILFWTWARFRPGGSTSVSSGRSFWILMLCLSVRLVLLPVPGTGIEALSVWLLPFCAFRVGGELNPRVPDLARLAVWCLVAGAFQILLMFLQRVGWDPLFAETTRAMAYAPSRMVGTIGYQNQVMDALLLMGCMVLLFPPTQPTRLWVGGIALLLCVSTAYRGGFLALVSVTTLALWRGRAAHRARGSVPRRIRIALWVCTGLATAFFLSSTGKDFRVRMAEILSPASSSSWMSRVWMWRAAATQFREHPLLGAGPGAFAREYGTRLGSLLPDPKSHEVLRQVVYAREAHFDLLQFVAEFGLAGFSALLLWLLQQQKAARSLTQRRQNTLAALAVCLLVLSCLNFTVQSAMAGPLAGLLSGLCLWRSPSTSRQGGRWLAWAETLSMLLLLSGGLGIAAFDLHLNQRIPAAIRDGHMVEAAAILPPYAHSHKALLGAAFADKGDLRTAERVLDAAAVGHSSPVLWNNLGHVRMSLGKFQEALMVYKLWASSGLQHDAALWNLSVCCEALGDERGAAEAALLRLRLWPEADSTTYLRTAVLGLKAGQSTRARQVLMESRTFWRRWTARDVAQLRNVVGATYLTEGRQEEARAWFLRALETEPGLESARRNLQALESP